MENKINKKRIVIALGGNALGDTLEEQMNAVKITAKNIVDLVESGCEVIIAHGNGPQVGFINNAMTEYANNHKTGNYTPLSVCVAMSQAYIGYDLQNALMEEFSNRNLYIPPISTLITQVIVDENDSAFKNPTKPIGQFMTKEESEIKAKELNWVVKEDAGRGYRRVAASPKPIAIVESTAIKAMLNENALIICCGGGGIPVVRVGKHLKGMPAVIDKDFAASVLAKELNADMLIILTAVEKVAINFGKPEQKWLDFMTINEAKKYCKEGQFASGSMLPKVEACIQFVESSENKEAMITLLEKAKEAINGKTGTRILK